MMHKMLIIGPLQLAICVVDGWMDGMGRMDRWEPYSLGKTHTENTAKQKSHLDKTKSYTILNRNILCLVLLRLLFSSMAVLYHVNASYKRPIQKLFHC